MEQRGELVVIGKDRVEIKLDAHKYPKRICVDFDGDHTGHPCNPKHYDELDYEIKMHHGHYILIIHWDVSGARIIKWSINY